MKYLRYLLLITTAGLLWNSAHACAPMALSRLQAQVATMQVSANGRYLVKHILGR